jgi:hypothetical protein
LPTGTTRRFAFDALQLVSNPACPADPGLFDPGFEQVVSTATPALAPFWVRTEGVTLVDDPTFAHSGRVAAKFETSACSNDLLVGSVTLRAPAGAAGPALRFWYKSSATANADLAFGLDMRATTPLAPSAAWRQLTACLPRERAGRPARLEFASRGLGGGCVGSDPVYALAIDDVELTTDATCPRRSSGLRASRSRA